jgi:glyoxylase-like metal-dependent hydrolase (beta-lactamase superfamily II)
MDKNRIQVQAFFDSNTWTNTYVVWDNVSGDTVIIDSVLDYDPISVSTSTSSLEQIYSFVEANNLNVRATLDTHIHADHMTGMQELKKRYSCATGMGSKVPEIQGYFKNVFAMDGMADDGSQFEYMLEDGQETDFGTVKVKTIHTPGHTPACASYLIDGNIFTGDAIFMPDFGTGRCDFPNGDANELYDSVIYKLYTLPNDTKVFVGHDYQPNGRELRYETTIGAAKIENIQLKDDTTREDFVQWRNSRDETLRLPKLIFQSVQVNINGGRLPAPNEAGLRMLKLPMNALI